MTFTQPSFTILHLLGRDHERLTFRLQGREQRLADVAGDVIRRAVEPGPGDAG